MRFLLKLTLDRPTSEEIMVLLPTEQRRGVELAEQGIREAVYLRLTDGQSGRSGTVTLKMFLRR